MMTIFLSISFVVIFILIYQLFIFTYIRIKVGFKSKEHDWNNYRKRGYRKS